MNTLRHPWQHPLTNRSGARTARPWLRSALVALRTPAGLAVFTALCVFALLLAFQKVVAQGVQRGELRNRATAAYAAGVWRCDALRPASERASCRVRLDAEHAAAISVYDRGAQAAMTIEPVQR